MPSKWDRGSEPPPDAGQFGPEPQTGGASRSRPALPWARGLDPYYLWARHSKWRGFKVHAGWDRIDAEKQEIQIIAVAKDQAMLDEALRTSWLRVPKAYALAPPGGQKGRMLHFTARVKRENEHLLLANPLDLRWELSLPLRDAERVALGSSLGLNGPTRNDVDFRATNVVAEEVAAAQPLNHPGALKSAVAVIDFGCPFLHERFATGPRLKTRVAAIWDQGSEVRSHEPAATASAQDRLALQAACQGWPWRLARHFDYGRELGPKALNAMVAASRSKARMLDEGDVYRGIDYLIDYGDARRRIWHATHGAHVLDVAAGHVDPLQPQASRGHDDAGRSPLVFVQLPSLTAADSSGGALSAHVLDGVRYALDVCAPEAPLVVNLSYGTFAGPHDGSSLVEGALDELLDMGRQNFAIVLAAGNARRERCHATRQVAHERSALLRCSLPAGDTTDSFVEVWYTAPRPGAELQARARTPNRLWSAWVGPQDEDVLRDATHERDVVAMLRHDASVPNGKGALMLLAVGPTAAPADVPGALADPGLWEIEIRLVGNQAAAAGSVEIQAWIERDDPGWATPEARSFFVDQLAEDERNTLSSLTTGQWTLAAGGFNRDTGQAASYSSTGPQRRGVQQRLLMAVCEEDEVLPTIAAAATRSGEVFRMNGTSVAAPVLARRVFNRMAQGPAVSNADWPTELKRLAALPVDGLPILKEHEPE